MHVATDESMITLVPDLTAHANELGLVRMRFLVDHTPYYAGHIAGFPADRASELLEAGIAAPCDQNGEPVTMSFAEPIAPRQHAAPTVDIPDGWETLHRLNRVRMAKALNPSIGSMTVEQADDIIRTELQRRERSGHG